MINEYVTTVIVVTGGKGKRFVFGLDEDIPKPKDLIKEVNRR